MGMGADLPGQMGFLIIYDRNGKEAGRFLIRDGENWAGIEDGEFTPQIDLEPFDLHHFVSRRHAVIRKSGSAYTIEHMGKTNPTAVNDKVLKTGEKTPLAANDRVTFANRIRAKFVLEQFPAE